MLTSLSNLDGILKRKRRPMSVSADMSWYGTDRERADSKAGWKYSTMCCEKNCVGATAEHEKLPKVINLAGRENSDEADDDTDGVALLLVPVPLPFVFVLLVPPVVSELDFPFVCAPG